MPATAPLPDPPISLPDPDAIRAAIGVADERARLLRRLLRLALQLRLHLTTADTITGPVRAREGGCG
jgi:hypothetical protein